MDRWMTIKRPFAILLSIGALAFAQRKEPVIYPGAGPGSGAPASPVRVMPPSRSLNLGRAAELSLGTLSAAEQSKLGPVGSKKRIGVHRALPDDALTKGTWTALPNGGSVWRLSIQSGRATAMRVEFTNFSVGAGRVWVHSANTVDGPYTDRGTYGNGTFWSATVTGEALTLEYQPDASGAGSGPPPFHVHRIAHHQFQPTGTNLPAQTFDPAASCNQDVNCFSDYLSTKRTVAALQFEETQGAEQGTFLCSGSLVGTRDNSFKPYLLTAGHCIHDEPAARSLETFWAYESAGCNLGPPANRGSLNSQNGGDLLAWATIEQGDYSLVLLPNVPAGVVFSGWDTGDPSIGSPVTGIHHPEGSYKRISFGTTFPSVDVVVGSDPAPAVYYHDVAWTLGITQPGSSGSPLFSSPGVVMGMLTYGPDEPGEEMCASGAVAGYAKFSNAYPYLAAYLEDLPFSEVVPSTTALQFTGLNHAMTGATVQTVNLTDQDPTAVNWSARADAPWILITRTSGTVSASSPASFQVSINPSYLVTSDTYTGTITILSGAAPPQFINVQAAMVIQTSNVVASASPNPVTESGNSWQLTVSLQETNGAATTLTAMKINGVDYSSSIAGWFGSTTLPANGTLSAVIHTSGLVTPLTEYFEFWGTDVASGQTWYRLMTVTFTQ
jgi:lysyl endopeptidase